MLWRYRWTEIHLVQVSIVIGHPRPDQCLFGFQVATTTAVVVIAVVLADLTVASPTRSGLYGRRRRGGRGRAAAAIPRRGGRCR